MDQADASHAQWEARIAQLHAQMETALPWPAARSQLASSPRPAEAEAAQLEALEAWEAPAWPWKTFSLSLLIYLIYHI